MLADEMENWAFTKVLQEPQGYWMRILNTTLGQYSGYYTTDLLLRENLSC